MSAVPTSMMGNGFAGVATAALALLGGLSLGAEGCSSSAAAHTRPMAVAPAPPPADDGRSAQGGGGGVEHAAALEQLKTSALGWRVDKQNSVRLELPDAGHWMRVKFWGVKSLVGFRYGTDHHALVAGFLLHVDNETAPGACTEVFEKWARPWVDAFEVTIHHEPPAAVPWSGKIADIDSLVATTATLGDRDQYAVSYATYPAWKGTCLVLGVAVPARGEIDRAIAVRDRFASSVLPSVRVVSATEPTELY